MVVVVVQRERTIIRTNQPSGWYRYAYLAYLKYCWFGWSGGSSGAIAPI